MAAPVRVVQGCGRPSILATVSAAQRRVMIAEAACYRAEARDFQSGAELDDWLEAELEVDQRLSEHGLTTEPSNA